MTALQLITRTAANNGWSVAKIRSSGDEHHFVVVEYVRDGELVEVQYTPSDSVHASLYIPRYGRIEFVGPTMTGRRAAAIRWLKRKTLQ